MVTSFCRLVKLSEKEFVTSDHTAKSALCCTTKLVEGINHETVACPAERSMFSFGAGMLRVIQMPPTLASVTATRFPSAEDANEAQPLAGVLMAFQVSPEL